MGVIGDRMQILLFHRNMHLMFKDTLLKPSLLVIDLYLGISGVSLEPGWKGTFDTA